MPKGVYLVTVAPDILCCLATINLFYVHFYYKKSTKMPPGYSDVNKNFVCGCGYIACGPEEALVITGCCHVRPKLICGGSAFVIPCFQKVQKLNLNIMTLQVESPKVYTMHGVPISVTGIAQVKVQSQNRNMLLTACELLLDKTESEIREVALLTLEGHQRSIMGTMTVEEIIMDRKKFSQNVFQVASSDLINMGLTVISYTIKDVSDDRGYCISLGRSRTGQVKRDARIGEAQYGSEAKIRSYLAEEQRMQEVLKNETATEKAKRDFELKKASFDLEVNTRQAEADLAYELQVAKTKQQIKEEQMKIELIERQQQTAVEEEEILKREKILNATIRLPADAEKYRLEKLSGAIYTKTLLEAEAEATATRLIGEANAFATEALAKSGADQLELKAAAWNEYRQAAIIDMVLDTLPRIAAEVASPLCETKKVTLISCGDGDVGASKLTRDVLEIIGNLPRLVSSMTGVDISKVLTKNN